MWFPYGPAHQATYHTGHGASPASSAQAISQPPQPSGPATTITSTAMPRRYNLTPEEIHAREQDEAKKTIAIAKDIKQGMSAAYVKTKHNVSESDIISRLATSTKQMHEILEVKGLDTETQTHMMAHNRRGAGLSMPQAVERTHREQDIQGELMRFEQYGIQPDKSKLYP